MPRRETAAPGRATWLAPVLVAALSTLCVATALAAINPTGRRLELQVPVEVNGQSAGTLLLAIEPDDAMTLDASGFVALLADRLEPEALVALRGASVEGRLSPQTLTAAGLPTTFDPVALSLVVTVPTGFSKRRRFSLSPVRETNAVTIPPERFSGFLNLGLAVLYDRRGRGTSGREDEIEFRLEMDGLMRLGGPVLAYEALQSVDREGAASFSRRATALLLDVPSRELRATLGDQSYLGRGLQRSVTLLGVGIGRDFALREGGGVRVSGRRAIELARSSRVDVLVGDRLLGTFDLPAGSYDFEDIPLAAGANDVTLRVRDDAGRVELIEFTELFDTGLLPAGRYDYGLGLGVRSRLGEADPEYLEDSPIGSAYVRRGFAGGATYGANVEATDSVWRLGAEWLRATRRGPLELLGAISGGSGTGYALGAGFTSVMRGGTSLVAGRLDLRAVLRSAEFVEAGDDLVSGTLSAVLAPDEEIDAGDADLTLSIGYGASLGSGTTLGLGSTFVRRADTTDLGTSVALSGRWRALPRLGWATRLRYVSRDAASDRLDLQFGLAWQIDRSSRVSVDHSTDGSDTRMDYSRDVGGGAVGAYGLGVAATRAPGDRTELDLRLARTFNRFDALATWRGSRADVVDDDFSDVGADGFAIAADPIEDARDVGSAVIRLDTAIGVAGDSAAVGRRIEDGFAIVRAHSALESRPVLIDASADGYVARTSAFGPALVQSPLPYRTGRILYEVEDLPLGHDIGSGIFDIRAPLGAGYRLQVGSAARVTVVGTLLDGDGDSPLALVTGNAVSITENGLAPVQFFTNRTGKFAIPGLLPGEYQIVLDTVPERRVTLSVPEKADSLLRVSELPVP